MTTKRYVVIGRPADPVLAAHLVTHGVGEEFDADFDKDTELQLLDGGLVAIVEPPKKARASGKSKSKED